MAYMAALAQIIAAFGAAEISSANAPKPAGNLQTPEAQGGGKPAAQSVFGSNVPSTSKGSPGNVQVNNYSPPGIGSMLAGAPAQAATTVYDESAGPAKPMPGTGTPSKSPGWDKALSNAPEAIAAIAPLLMGQPQRGKQTIPLGAQGGGAGGSLVPGFNLPTQGMRRPTIGELLASLPRPRYG